MRTSLISRSILLLSICGSALATPVEVAPEPGTIMLAASGVAIAGFITWRRKK